VLLLVFSTIKVHKVLAVPSELEADGGGNLKGTQATGILGAAQGTYRP
jgi:hypothetical protein